MTNSDGLGYSCERRSHSNNDLELDDHHSTDGEGTCQGSQTALTIPMLVIRTTHDSEVRTYPDTACEYENRMELTAVFL